MIPKELNLIRSALFSVSSEFFRFPRYLPRPKSVYMGENQRKENPHG